MENGTASEAGSEQAAGKPALAWLQIHAFPERNVAPCRLRFGEGFNVLLGLNATGKTTLLEIIAAAMSFNFSRFAKEPFDVEYEMHVPGGSMHARVNNTRVNSESLPRDIHHRIGDALTSSVDLRVRLVSPPDDWHIQGHANGLQISGPYDSPVSVDGASIVGPDFVPYAYGQMLRTSTNPSSPRLLASLAPLLSWWRMQRFDESLGLFDLITNGGAWVEVFRVAGSPPLVWTTDRDVVPRSLSEEIVRQCVQQAEGGDRSISSKDVAFLSRVAELLDFRTVRVDFRLVQRKMSAGETQMRFGDIRFAFERHDGSLITHAELSYGQKRLLSLLYYLEMHPHTIIADELVDGLHHRWIDDAIEAIGDRQAFMASQNPLILDHLEFSSPEEVASTFVVCRVEKRDDGERLAWANMSDLDAERFFRAYEVDVQHVSEILLTKGLW
jgi:hypothetical protein